MAHVEGHRRYHFHPPGLVYLGVTVLIMLGAINSQNNLLFLALGFAIGGIVVSGLLSGAALMGLEVVRERVTDCGIGEAMTIRYVVRNRNRMVPAFGLHVEERRSNGRRRANWATFMTQPHAHVAHVGPRSEQRVEAIAWPRRRGRVTFVAVRVWSTFPFGIVKKSVTFEQPGAALVRPLVLPLRPGTLRPALSEARRGYVSSQRVGSGSDFFGLREYVAGDSPKGIAWKPSARTGDLIVKQRAAPSPQRVWVSVELNGVPDSGLARAIRERTLCLAASALSQSASEGAAVGLVLPGAGLAFTPKQGHWHVQKLLNQLALAEEPSYIEAGDRSSTLPPGETVVRVAEHASGDTHMSGTDFDLFVTYDESDRRLASLSSEEPRRRARRGG